MQPTIKAYDSSTWVLDDKVGSASSYNYDAYGYGVYYDTFMVTFQLQPTTYQQYADEKHDC